MLDLTGREPAVRDPEQPLAPPRGSAAVALEDVTARYALEDEDALQGFGLQLDPGRRVALVGPSGAGKTTVTNLLFRFLDPDDGRVTIAGEDVRRYRQEDVRATFALAGQEAHLFDSSIRENLRIGRPTATDGEARGRARARAAGGLGRVPPRRDRHARRRGGNGVSPAGSASGSCSRAPSSKAPVLVLDEPTAHLDPPTAERLMDDVLDAAGERTVLLITHRREGLERMDEVVALPVRHEAVEAAQVSLLRWLRRQLAQPMPLREHLEAAVENDDPGEARLVVRQMQFTEVAAAQRRAAPRRVGAPAVERLAALHSLLRGR